MSIRQRKVVQFWPFFALETRAFAPDFAIDFLSQSAFSSYHNMLIRMTDEEIPELVPLTSAADATSSTSEAKANSDSEASSSADSAKAAALPRVPITIVTGWLGAGKTTMLTHVLKQMRAQGKTIAVIQNEASALGVEDALRLKDDSGVFGERAVLAQLVIAEHHFRMQAKCWNSATVASVVLCARISSQRSKPC